MVDDPHAALELVELRQHLARALDQLPAPGRRALVAHHIDGATVTATARELRASAGHVHRLLIQSQRRLRQLLPREYGDEARAEFARQTRITRRHEPIRCECCTARIPELCHHCPCGCGAMRPCCKHVRCECGCGAYQPYCAQRALNSVPAIGTPLEHDALERLRKERAEAMGFIASRTSRAR